MTGVGGVGKTRLALRVAAEAQADFPDGVWVCELAAVRDGWLVPDVVATTLGVQEPKGLSVTDGLVDVLRSRHALLVIDNCEHVLDAAAHLIDALASGCRNVTILATSREPLGVDGEHVLPVRPLAVPGPGDDHDLERIAEIPSVALFLDRTAAVLPSFTLNTNNITAITEICRRLDGLPLAIELAATRLPFQSVSEIANLLERRLHFLQSTKRLREERHTTLATVVDWSYNLLEPLERTVFVRLSVLAGTFTVDDAMAVAGDADTDQAEIVEHVIGLVRKSMLAANTEHTPTRYTMLETLRIYGRERLAHAGRLDAAKRRHAAHFVAVAEASAAGLVGPDEASWADRVESMLDDLRSAHSWALLAEPATAIRLSAALIRYTSAHGPSEIYNWAERAAAAAADLPGPALATTLAVAAAGAARRGDLAGASERAQRGLSVVAPEDPVRRYPLWVLARVASFEGRFLAAAKLYTTVADIAGSAGDTHCVAYVTASGSLQHAYLGDVDTALRLARRADTLAKLTGNPTALAWVGYALGVALQDREPEQALTALDTAFTVGRDGHNTYIPGVALSVAAGLMTRHGDPHRAALLAARVIDYWSHESHWAQQWVALRTVIGLLAKLGEDEAAAMVHSALQASTAAIQPAGADAALLDAVITTVEERLGADEFAAAVAKGRTMSDDDAVAFTKATLVRITRNGSAPSAYEYGGSPLS
jgi:predicted ATPase